MFKYMAYLPLFDDSTMVAHLARYGGTVGIEEFWAEGYGLLIVIFGGGHSTLTAAYINGVHYGNFVEVEDNDILPMYEIELFQNYPNPFNPITTISFELPVNIANPIIEIFNVKGEKVKSLYAFPNEGLGTRCVVWNGTDNYRKPVSSGVYLYRIKSDECESEMRKMILIK